LQFVDSSAVVIGSEFTPLAQKKRVEAKESKIKRRHGRATVSKKPRISDVVIPKQNLGVPQQISAGDQQISAGD
jgi:hypothetical protein